MHIGGDLIILCKNSRSPTNPGWPGDWIYQLDRRGDNVDCFRDHDGNKWCKFLADTNDCFQNGKGDQRCFTTLPPSRPYDRFE